MKHFLYTIVAADGLSMPHMPYMPKTLAQRYCKQINRLDKGTKRHWKPRKLSYTVQHDRSNFKRFLTRW